MAKWMRPGGEHLADDRPIRRRSSRRAVGAGDVDHEHQADEIAASFRASGHHRAGDLDDGAIPTSVRGPIEEWSGVDLSAVTLRDAPLRPDSLAWTDGTEVAVPAWLRSSELGEHVLRHELVHAAQQRAASGPALPAKRGSRQFFDCGSKKAPPVLPPIVPKTSVQKLRDGDPIDESDAIDILTKYQALGPADRDTIVADFHSLGVAKSGVQRLLAALSPAEREKWAPEIKDLLDRLQMQATLAAAGLTLDQLGALQGSFMQGRAEAEAMRLATEEAKKKGRPAPKSVTPTQVAAAHEKLIAAGSVSKPTKFRWSKLTAPQRTSWEARAKKAIASVVSLAAGKAPHLGLKEADITFDQARLDRVSDNVFALSGRPYTMGMSWVEAAEADPEYVLGATLHEIFGHPAYAISGSIERQVYQAGTANFPEYRVPRSDRDELRLYDYLGTEIYAEMREFEFYKEVSPADRKKGVKSSDDPKQDIEARVKKLKQFFEPKVAEALIRGMWERFRVDPRIVPGALALFKAAADTHFPGVIP